MNQIFPPYAHREECIGAAVPKNTEPRRTGLPKETERSACASAHICVVKPFLRWDESDAS